MTLCCNPCPLGMSVGWALMDGGPRLSSPRSLMKAHRTLQGDLRPKITNSTDRHFNPNTRSEHFITRYIEKSFFWIIGDNICERQQQKGLERDIS